ncbi:HslU--HslV peptidase ATPase subunit, partial [Alphaproteobacteria bacterium]|nr:HslU--HslV peptidase ATPase subunit [Alphaproteobacteria bacterium]
PENSLIRQYKALMATENVTLEFEDAAIDKLADLSTEINSSVENIGARRLHTVLERLLEEISFKASDMGGETVTITEAMVTERVGDLVKDTDLSKFIL